MRVPRRSIFRGGLVCLVRGTHKYALDTVPDGAVFYRLDCERCGGGPIDGAALKLLAEKHPNVRRLIDT